jgi:DNA-binding IclR family transcriptional regulator
VSPAENALSGRQPKAVESALRVLDAVARNGQGVTAKDIAASLSMPSATVYRLLTILVGEGYLVRLPDLSGFALGQKVSTLVDAAVQPVVCTAARNVIAEMRLSVRFGVQLFYYTNTRVRAADTDPEYPPPVDIAVVNTHLYASAVGKLLLAEKADPDATVAAAAMRAITSRTIVAKADLRSHLDLVAGQGFATQAGELSDDSVCLAVPVRSPHGTLVAAVALTGRVEHERLITRQVGALQELASKLSPLLA